MRALEFITGHVIYNPAYTYKFQLKTTEVLEWGDCLDDCPTEAVQKVCIDEPNFPIMADGSDRAVNYTANYTLGSGLVTDEVKPISSIFDKCSMLLQTIWP